MLFYKSDFQAIRSSPLEEYLNGTRKVQESVNVYNGPNLTDPCIEMPQPPWNVKWCGTIKYFVCLFGTVGS